jgi:hypothetical protein
MRRTILTFLVAALGALALSSTALAHDRGGDDHSRVLKNLGCGTGTLVVNIKYTVKNDLDTTVPINNVQYNWAVDNYTRRVLVWKTGADTFCAATLSNGTFTTLAGHSPGGTGMIPAGIKGKFGGGYVTKTFTGALLATPLSSTTGNLGEKDFACVASADHNNATKSCPGTFDWFSQYFTATSGADWALAKYKFVYHAKGNGTWVDMMSGGTIRTHGDIRATTKAAKKVEEKSSSRHDSDKSDCRDDENENDDDDHDGS